MNKEELIRFCESDERQVVVPCSKTYGKYNTILVKVDITENLVGLIYGTTPTDKEKAAPSDFVSRPSSYNDFALGGFFHKGTREVYDLTGRLENEFGYETIGVSSIEQKAISDVRRDAIKLLKPPTEKAVAEAKELNGLKKNAARCFLNGETEESSEFPQTINENNVTFTDNDIDEYLSNGHAWSLKKATEATSGENCEGVVIEAAQKEAIRQLVEEMESTPNRMHAIRALRKAIANGCKTVAVELRCGETIKMETRGLLDDDGSYGDWYVSAKDRHLVKGGFRVEDIDSLKYSGKVIYERPEYLA